MKEEERTGTSTQISKQEETGRGNRETEGEVTKKEDIQRETYRRDTMKKRINRRMKDKRREQEAQ